MATSTDYSYGAPADFPMTTLYVNTKIKNQLIRCPLCYKSRKVFYCPQCIKDGDFYHSNPLSERFAEKRMNLTSLKIELKRTEEKCEKLLARQLKTNRLKNEIDSCHDRLKILETIIQEKEQSIYSDKHRLDDLIKINQQKSKLKLNTLTKNRIKDLLNSRQQMDNIKINRQQSLHYQEKLVETAEITELNKKHFKSQQPKLVEIQKKLRIRVKRDIANLIQYIFPIHLVQPTHSDFLNSSGDSDFQDTISAIADASRTTFVKGKWIFTDISGELQHCIVAPTLPGSGDYSAYNAWVAANKVIGPNEDCDERNPAYSISAALTYTTQLVNVLSFYLDVRLPYHLNYTEFCENELTDQQFARKVAKLNSNILHLCFSQNINPELIHPTRTLHNLLALLDSLNQMEDIGRKTPFEIEPAMAMALEEPLIRELEANYDPNSDDESDHLPCEWEAVVNCPDSFNTEITPYYALMATQQSTSIAGGLVTSAAASIASIFRGWTGK